MELSFNTSDQYKEKLKSEGIDRDIFGFSVHETDENGKIIGGKGSSRGGKTQGMPRYNPNIDDSPVKGLDGDKPPVKTDPNASYYTMSTEKFSALTPQLPRDASGNVIEQFVPQVNHGYNNNDNYNDDSSSEIIIVRPPPRRRRRSKRRFDRHSEYEKRHRNRHVAKSNRPGLGVNRDTDYCDENDQTFLNSLSEDSEIRKLLSVVAIISVVILVLNTSNMQSFLTKLFNSSLTSSPSPANSLQGGDIKSYTQDYKSNLNGLWSAPTNFNNATFAKPAIKQGYNGLFSIF